MKAIELLDFGTSRLPAVCGLYIDVSAIRPFAHVFEIKCPSGKHLIQMSQL